MSAASIMNHVRAHRERRGWSQAELAERAGLSRSGVSAIEQGRLVPSTTAALTLASSLGVSVEDLFSLGDSGHAAPEWAWEPSAGDGMGWNATVGQRAFRYPLERTLAGQLPHDPPIWSAANAGVATDAPPTVVLAGCDPAVGVLAAGLARVAGFRLLPLFRSSRRALELLADGRVHLAGVHLGDNDAAVRALLGPGHALIRVASWEEGLALEPGLRLRSVRSAMRANLRWVGREEGSGARRCMDELFEDRAPRARRRPARTAPDHEGVAAAIKSGWAQAGVCIRLTAEQAQLRFLPVQTEALELCTRVDLLADPGVRAVVRTLRTSFFQEQVGSLPGYDTAGAGEVREIR